jgi:pimeloyl-ACP methyl ester carboxylesterase
MQALLPHAHLAVMEDAGHFAMMEQADAVSRAFAQWMQT